MDFANFLIQTLNSVQYGLLLFMLAAGLTLIFGIMGVVNLAHGSFYMLGAYLAFALSSQVPYFSIIWTDPSRNWSIMAAATLIVIVGVVDDLWDLDWMIKLGAQFLAAGIVVGFGGIQIYYLPVGTQLAVSSWVPTGR